MLNVVTVDGDGAVRCIPPRPAPAMTGVSAVLDGGGFTLRRTGLGERDMYYRVGPGLLEWSENPADLAEEPDGHPTPATPGKHLLQPGTLLALVHGLAPPPDATPLPGARRLALGTAVHVGSQGVVISRQRPSLPDGPADLLGAVADSLRAAPDAYAIAYGGGLSSAFLAVAALAAGHRPPLLHADLGLPGRRPAPAAVPGLPLSRVPVDVSDLLDHHRAPLGGPLPTLPDVEFPRRLAAALTSASGRPLASAVLLEDLAGAKLPDVDRGPRDWRLLTCEPFHLSGVLPSLREATALLGEGVVRDDRPGPGTPDDAQTPGGPPPPPPLGRRDLPVLTAQGRVALQSVQQASLSVWKDHLDFLGPVLGRADAGLAERVPRCSLVLPALDPAVLGAVQALPPERLGRISGGLFRTNRPMTAGVARHGLRGLRRASSSFDLRLAAASYLHGEHAKIVIELERECALADMGLIDVGAVTGLLKEGPARADHALPLLRLLWIDRWLKG